MKTDYSRVYYEYKEYICSGKPTRVFLEYIRAHYVLEQIEENLSSWQPRLTGPLNVLRMYYDANGLGDPDNYAVIRYYIVHDYDPRAAEFFQECGDHNVYLVLDEYSGFFLSNSALLMTELKIIRGIDLSEPVDFNDTNVRDYLSNLVLWFEEYPAIWKHTNTRHLRKQLELAQIPDMPE